MTRWLARSLAIALLPLIAGCARGNDPSGPPVQVLTGVFFGGQLQQRTQWPLVIDPTRQTQGFRVRFREPPTSSKELAWRVTRPRLDHKRRVVSTESQYSVTLPAGITENDQLVTIDENDRSGKWRLAVSLDGKTMYETTIEVVPFAATAGDD